MGEESISVSVPLDCDGFLRRECPNCERQFKWRVSDPDPEDHSAVPHSYFCPYCGEPASLDSWWTREQLEYGQAMAVAEVVPPKLRQFVRNVDRGNRRNSFISIDIDSTEIPEPEPLTEPNE